MARIDKELERLGALPPAMLHEEWSRWFDTPCPRLSPDLMRHALAYAMQEKAFGKLGRRIARQIAEPSVEPVRQRIATRPGMQLVRSWNDRTISVQVLEEGFLFEERTYRSLSAIAREITGVQWSGPRFFGLDSHGR